MRSEVELKVEANKPNVSSSLYFHLSVLLCTAGDPASSASTHSASLRQKVALQQTHRPPTPRLVELGDGYVTAASGCYTTSMFTRTQRPVHTRTKSRSDGEHTIQ